MHIRLSDPIVGRIAVTDGISEEALLMLRDAGHEIELKHFETSELNEGILSDFDAVVVRSATMMTGDVIRASVSEEGGIKFIGRAGVGVDNIDVEVATELGVIVCNTPGSSTRSVVELTIGHLIASTRNIPRADRTLRNGEWAKATLKGTEIGGKRLGLIGFGKIARGVANIASGMGMEIHVYDPYVDADFIDSAVYTMHNDIDEIFRICTHISIHCNLSDETRHLVNSRRLSLMGGVGADGTECGNHLVSCARGGIIDETAAFDALHSGQLSSLALDVFETEPVDDCPLLHHENFHGTPHIAASTIEAQARISREITAQLLEFFEGERPSSALN